MLSFYSLPSLQNQEVKRPMGARKKKKEEECPNCKDGPEFYRMYFSLFKFDVDLARKLVSDGRESVELEPEDVKYAVEWSRICKQHVAHVDVQFPGIVAHYWYPEKDGTVLHGTVLIDGHHRAARTLELNVPFFIHVLSEEESRQVILRAPDLQAPAKPTKVKRAPARKKKNPHRSKR